jgi:hypothetical protein
LILIEKGLVGQIEGADSRSQSPVSTQRSGLHLGNTHSAIHLWPQMNGELARSDLPHIAKDPLRHHVQDRRQRAPWLATVE